VGKTNNDQDQPPVPIAIVGMAGMFAKSADLKEYWRLLSRAEDGISEVPATHWSAEDFFNENPKTPDHVYCKRGGFLPGISFDPAEFGIPPSSLEATDTSQLLGLVAAKLALKDAGYDDTRPFDRDRASVIIGVTGTQELVIPLGARLGHPLWRKALDAEGVDTQTADAVIARIADGYVPWQENSFPGLLGNVVAGRICNRLDFGGTNCVVDAACASSMSAINLAILELEAGRSDMVISGGIDTLNDIFMHMCFAKTQILSPTGDAKPFSSEADGTVLGEGIGLLVLKRLEDAERDKDRIYAVIKALRSSSDGKSQSIYAPRPEGQEKALRRAYQAAQVDPATVGLVEAHGTGTRVGDAVEFTALKNTYNGRDSIPGACAIGSVKSNIGHTKAAAGAAGLIKATLAVHHKVLLPTIKADEPDPKLDIANSPFYLSTATRPWLLNNGHPRRAAVSAFGFGGSNFHMVLEEHESRKTGVAWDGSIQIAAFSGLDINALKTRLEAFAQATGSDTKPDDYARLCFDTRFEFDVAAPCRLLIAIERDTDRQALLADALQALDDNRDKAQWQSGDIYFSSAPKKGKLAFLFPGQGSQYVNMARDLACCFPEAHAAFETANHIHIDGTPLGELIFPRPAADRTETAQQEENLRRTDAAQPAIGAASLGMLKILERFNVAPDTAAGHSYGELAALYAAGRLDEETFFSLSADRGRFMAAAGDNDSGESGTMLAVKAPLEEIDALLATLETDVILANRNSPSQGVLSGSSKGIKIAQKACREMKFRAIELPVAAAFHSHLVEHARQPFEKSLSAATFAPAVIPVFANTTGEAYPESEDKARATLGAQLVSPVHFKEEVENLYAAGVRTFLEVGPKPVLSGLVRQILKGKEHIAVAVDQSGGKAFGLKDLAKALCRLAAAGYPVDLPKWEPMDPADRKPVMDVPLSGANFRNPSSETETGPQSKAENQIRSKASAENPTIPAKPAGPVAAPSQPAATAPTRPVKQTTTESVMQDQSSQNPQQINIALKTVQEGLQTLQSLQMKTAETHQKFLETQAQASKALQQMMRATSHLTGFGDHADIPVPEFQVSAEPGVKTTAASFNTVPHPEPHPATASPAAPAQAPPAPAGPAHTPQNSADQPIGGAHAAEDKVSTTLLDVVSRLTGYPTEMLNMDMDIEADLGIDSIKRVEILSTLEEEMPGLPSVGPEMMGSLKTLGQIVAYLTEAAPASAPPKAAEPVADVISSTAAATRNDVLGTLLSVVSELTGYPAEMLQPEMDIEADLGIDSIKRVEILSTLEEKMPGLPSVGPEMMGSLKTLGQIADYLAADARPGHTPAAAPPAGRPAAQETVDQARSIQEVLIATVSELTGYPQEMLNPEMDIEADLGIDSIKRVEILSTMEEKMPGLPQIGPEMMGDLRTLGHIMAFLNGTAQSGQQAVPEVTAAGAAAAMPQKGSSPSKGSGKLPPRRIIVPAQTPADRRPRITLPADTQVWITTENPGLAAALERQFNSQNVATQLIGTDTRDRIIAGEKDIADCGGLILTAGGTDFDADVNAVSELLEADFLLAKAVSADLTAAREGRTTFLATVTDLDGAFGFLRDRINNPATGGLAALAKTAGIEWPQVHCTAFDLDPAWHDYDAAAAAIIAELLTPDPTRPREIGLAEQARYTLTVETVDPAIGKLDLSSKDVAILTGGARGVTAAAAIALAEQTGCTTILIGRSTPMLSEPHWITDLTEEAAMKKAILEYHFQGKASPREIESEYKAIAAGRSINDTLRAIEQAGHSAAYFAADVRDAKQMRELVKSIRTDFGPIRAVIHGAGVLEDRLISDKTADQFQKVYSTKVAGLTSLLAATADDDLKYLVLFSSVSARCGNQGQVDYAMANEVLNKLARAYATEHGNCRVAAINWGPWDGGMVSPALKREFQKAGVELISIRGGVQRMLQEMAADAGTPVETVMGAVFEPTAGGDLSPEDDLNLLVKHQVDTAGYPVLASHILAGRPVVPFALMAEWLGHGALHDNPGLFLHGLDDMRLLNGIKLDEEKKTIRLLAGKAVKANDAFAVNVQIRNGRHPDGSEFIHSSARAILTDREIPPPRLNGEMDIAAKPYPRDLKEVYEKILFHGDDLRGITRIAGFSEQGMIAEVATAPSPLKWITQPLRSRWIADPLVLDSAFQLAIIWCYETQGVVSLPSYAASYRQYRNRFPEGGIRAILKVHQVTPHKMTGDFTFIDQDDEIIAKLEGYEAIMDAGLQKAFIN